MAVWHWDYKSLIEWAWSRARDVFKFSEMSNNILKMVQDRDIVTMEDKYEIIWAIEWHDCR